MVRNTAVRNRTTCSKIVLKSWWLYSVCVWHSTASGFHVLKVRYATFTAERETPSAVYWPGQLLP